MTTRGNRDDAGETAVRAGEPGVVRLSDARRQAEGRASAARAILERDLEETRGLLDRGLSSEAESRLRHIVSSARGDHDLQARARCMLSAALEMQGRFIDSLEAVKPYESATARARLTPETASALRVQTGLAYNYNGDQPRAIAVLNAELREAEEAGSDARAGAAAAALARVYRHINEFSISNDFAQKALEYFRRTGDWRGLAESYFSVGLTSTQEGRPEEGLENFEQAAKIVGDRPAPYILGRIYNNMAGALWFLKRPHDGIRSLQKAVAYYESTEHRSNAAIGYNNLGINLTLIGEWGRAEECLRRALDLAMQVDQSKSLAPMIYDSLGELHLMRGDLEDAQEELERAVELAAEHGNKWYERQAVCTLGRCHLSMGRTKEALAEGEAALALAEKIRDREALCQSTLLLAEARLAGGELDECAALLQKVHDLTDDTTTDLAVTGELQRLCGLLALARGDASLASHHFGRCSSIFELLGDRYRSARAKFLLGRACAAASLPERAAEHLGVAAHALRELGARIDLARAEELIASLEGARDEQVAEEPPASAQLLTLRLAEAAASRELLLRELAAVLQQETRARRVLITEAGDEGASKVVIAHGYAGDEAARDAAALDGLKTDEEREAFARKRDARLVVLRGSNAPPAVVLISPRESAAGGTPLEPLLRVVELGLDVCALRARVNSGRGAEVASDLAGASLMPGFIHSSPAMTRLVDEVHKIRSSDVTVLVTGESGTGKELVARAIHAISSRRSKVFVPFNCTAVPKELSEGYLFGYRRGAFTGAVSDSPGVIRTAAGGTLFLDEIGDLPLDVQPKLLRFLQEGEIQPLGEQRPVKVDVRIIAATNTDLEKMVTEGRFREDLYYRLNVIRLRVPPLRERRSEIPTIVNYYVNHYAAKFGRRDVQVTPQAVDLLMVCDWPGNVRQLCNEIQRVVARAEDGTVITPDHLSPELTRASASLGPAAPANVTHIGEAAARAAEASAEGLTLADAMAELERRMIAEALRKHKGNISRAARELGLTRRGLYLKLERYEMSASA